MKKRIKYRRTIGGFLAIFLLMAIFALSLPTVGLSALAWTASKTPLKFVGPNAMAPTDQNTIYVGTSDLPILGTHNGNGMWKTTNGGTNWFQINDSNLLSTWWEFAIAVDPTASNTVYVSPQTTGSTETLGQGVYKSTNGGTNWYPTNTGLPTPNTSQCNVFSMAIDKNTGAIYAGTTDLCLAPNYQGIFKSTNQGGSWFPINTGIITDNLNVAYVTTTPVTDNIYCTVAGQYLLGTCPPRVYKSTNGGTNWSNVTGNLASIDWSGGLITYFMLGEKPQDDSTIYLSAYTYGDMPEQGLYKTTNSGTNWFKIKDGKYGSAYIVPNDPSNIYLGGECTDNGVYKNGCFHTTNAGATSPNWVVENEGLPTPNPAVAFMSMTPDGSKIYASVRKDPGSNPDGNDADGVYKGAIPSYPTGSILINNGAASTNDRNVTLALTATSNNGSPAGINGMAISNDNFSSGTNWESYTSTKSWQLTEGDGNKTVYAKFRGNNGETSPVYSDSIIYSQAGDTTKPTGTVLINNGAEITYSTAVNLTLWATDNVGVTQMMISNNSIFSGSSWEAYATSKAWTLTSGYGIKYVYVKYKDAAGNISDTYSDSIIYSQYGDTTPPTGTVTINNGAQNTTTRDVTLGFQATDNVGVTDLIVSEDPSFTGASWTTYVSTMGFTLSAGDGEKTVYAKFRDAAGNPSWPVSDSIILAMQAPVGSISINNGAANTHKLQVTLTISATSPIDTVTEMLISNEPSFYGANWESYATTKSWTLTDGDGEKYVYIKFKDSQGRVSAVYSDSITYEKLKITIYGPPTSNSGKIHVWGEATPSCKVKIFVDGAFLSETTSTSGGEWASGEITLSQGTHTLFARVIDAEGASADSASITVIVDPKIVEIDGAKIKANEDWYYPDPNSGIIYLSVHGGTPLYTYVIVTNNPTEVKATFKGRDYELLDPDGNGEFEGVICDWTWHLDTFDILVTATDKDGKKYSKIIARITLQDPSGFIYADLNKDGKKQDTEPLLEGAKVTLYWYSSSGAVPWDAQNYRQKNPLHTDSQGRYGWDVHAGKYYVKVEKDFFKEQKSRDVTIPPPVTNLNIGLIPDFSLERLYGEDRYLTAIEISKKAYPNKESLSQKTAILTRGDLFPDALAGAPLAAKYDAPILLSRPTSLPNCTRDEIIRLGAQKVIILGSEDAISSDVVKSLKDDCGIKEADIKRIGGVDRYETASLIAKNLTPPASGAAIIATGENYPDALASASMASYKGLPILLVRGDLGNVTSFTQDALKKLKIKRTIIVGGPDVVPDEIAYWLDGNDYPSMRLYGADRYGTAKAIADWATDKGAKNPYIGMDSGSTFIATGENFPDALTLGPYGGSNKGPILLVSKDLLRKPTEEWLQGKKGFIYKGIIAGGADVVPDTRKDEIKSIIGI